MEQFINPIESSLLTDLLGLYTCDLTRDTHTPGHVQCLPCAKQAIIFAIVRYQKLDALYRDQALASLSTQPVFEDSGRTPR